MAARLDKPGRGRRTCRRMALDDVTTPLSDRGPRALVLEVVLPDAVAEEPLPEHGEVVIGRSRGAAVRIDHDSVSREHARLRLGASITLEDLGSRNGTFVRGVPLRPGEVASVGIGDAIEIGSVLVRLAVALPVVAAASAPSVPAAAAAASAVPAASSAAPAAPRAERRTPGSGRALLDAHEGWYASASRAMQEVAAEIEQVARSEMSVLILGETGVGKEVCAEEIHRRSARAPRTLLRLNCSALPDSLLESELFGHDRGAFTGAAAAKPGLIESADGGTVFLDEIGELPASAQAKLLRVLDRREVMRLGALRARTVDVRFVSATHRSLDAEVAAGRFREDLYYRLAGMTIRIPPLRERPDELVPLARRFVEDAAGRLGRPAPEITAAALAALAGHAWPGNIRELRNAMERAVVVCGVGPISPAHLPLGERRAAATGPPAAVPPPPGSSPGLRDEVEALERARIVAALEAAGGNQSEAARRLGMSRGALLARLRAWGLLRRR